MTPTDLRSAMSLVVALVLSLAVSLFACTTSSQSKGVDAGLASSGGGTGPGACSNECSETLCVSKAIAPTPTCEACLKRSVIVGAKCSAPVSLACEADPECVKQQRCVAVCLSPDGGAGDAGPDVGCLWSGEEQACVNCCAQNHPGGYQTFFSALVSCGCGH